MLFMADSLLLPFADLVSYFSFVLFYFGKKPGGIGKSLHFSSHGYASLKRMGGRSLRVGVYTQVFFLVWFCESRNVDVLLSNT